ncbi:conserved hypothetical protein [Gammaproteobacteria bacterium]
MKKSNFKEWNKLDLEKTFGLCQVRALSALDDLIKESETQLIDDSERRALIRRRDQLIYRGDDWNEIELIEHFIAPILTIVDFNTDEFGLFAERTISAAVEEYELSGEPDAIIAKGRRAPEIPYFCFHEYKKENEPRGDPAGQTLVAMLVAQELNKHQAPVYGLYVSGSKWHFMALREKNYAISVSFPADRDELFDIFKILKQLKQLIEVLVRTA